VLLPTFTLWEIRWSGFPIPVGTGAMTSGAEHQSVELLLYENLTVGGTQPAKSNLSVEEKICVNLCYLWFIKTNSVSGIDCFSRSDLWECFWIGRSNDEPRHYEVRSSPERDFVADCFSRQLLFGSTGGRDSRFTAFLPLRQTGIGTGAMTPSLRLSASACNKKKPPHYGAASGLYRFKRYIAARSGLSIWRRSRWEARHRHPAHRP
jgi:hypothetical protein